MTIGFLGPGVGFLDLLQVASDSEQGGAASCILRNKQGFWQRGNIPLGFLLHGPERVGDS